jgi:hypothetical protein
MFEKLFISLWYSLPIAGITYMLSKFFIGLIKLLRSEESSENSRKMIKWRLFVISIGFFFGLSFLTIWNSMVWFPGLELPMLFKIICLILFIPYICLTGFLMGLGKAIGAGSVSATSILTETIADLKKEYAIDKVESANKKLKNA